MERPKQRYLYDGAVFNYFGDYVGHYQGETMAVSPAQALNNFRFQVKMKLGLDNRAFIRLPDEVTCVTEDGKVIAQPRQMTLREYKEMQKSEKLNKEKESDDESYHQITIEEFLKSEEETE